MRVSVVIGVNVYWVFLYGAAKFIAAALGHVHGGDQEVSHCWYCGKHHPFDGCAAMV